MKKSVLTGAALLTAAALSFGGCSLFVEETAFKSPAASGHAMQMPVEELRQKYTGYGFSALKTEEEQRLYAGIDEAVNKQSPTSLSCTRTTIPRCFGSTSRSRITTRRTTAD